jgi:hypothetical protein
VARPISLALLIPAVGTHASPIGEARTTVEAGSIRARHQRACTVEQQGKTQAGQSTS